MPRPKVKIEEGNPRSGPIRWPRQEVPRQKPCDVALIFAGRTSAIIRSHLGRSSSSRSSSSRSSSSRSTRRKFLWKGTDRKKLLGRCRIAVRDASFTLESHRQVSRRKGHIAKSTGARATSPSQQVQGPHRHVSSIYGCFIPTPAKSTAMSSAATVMSSAATAMSSAAIATSA